MSALLPGDLYRFQDLLPPDEAAVVEKVRTFLRAEVTPIANDCWARAELIVGRAVTGLSAFV